MRDCMFNVLRSMSSECIFKSAESYLTSPNDYHALQMAETAIFMTLAQRLAPSDAFISPAASVLTHI